MEYIDECTFVHLKIRCWSGQKSLTERDFKLGEGGELPSKKAARLGNKFVYNKDKLKIFQSLRTAASRSCLAVGARMMGAFAIHNQAINELQVNLDNMKAEYEKEVQNLLSNYHQDAQNWISSNFKHQVYPVPIADVERAFRFDYTLYQISGENLPDSAEFADSLLDDVSKDVKALWESSVSGKPKVSQRFLNQPFEAIYNKLKLLSFGDGRILKLLSVMDKLRVSFPKSGGILNGSQEHLLLTNILMALMSPDRLEDILNQQGNIWSLPSGQQPQPIAVAPVQQTSAPSAVPVEQPQPAIPVTQVTPVVAQPESTLQPQPEPKPEPEIILPENEIVTPATNLGGWF